MEIRDILSPLLSLIVGFFGENRTKSEFMLCGATSGRYTTWHSI